MKRLLFLLLTLLSFNAHSESLGLCRGAGVNEEMTHSECSSVVSSAKADHGVMSERPAEIRPFGYGITIRWMWTNKYRTSQQVMWSGGDSPNPCPVGEKLNQDTGFCENEAPSCPDGQTPDPETGECKDETPPQCEEGQEVTLQIPASQHPVDQWCSNSCKAVKARDANICFGGEELCSQVMKFTGDTCTSGGGSSGPPDVDPGTGDPGTGDPGTGDPGTGDPGTGDPGTGDPGTGDPGTGEPGECDPETEDCGSGGGQCDPETEDCGSGVGNRDGEIVGELKQANQTLDEMLGELQQGFCEKNEDHESCQEKSAQAGRDDKGQCQEFTCEGDKVQCEILRVYHVEQCLAFDDENAAANDAYDSFVETGKYDSLITRELDFSDVQSASVVSFSGGCPPPLTAEVFGYVVEFPWTPLCDFARLIYWIVIGGASFQSVRIAGRAINS